jgi:hypothetical protein
MKTGELDYIQLVKNYEFGVGLDPERYDYELIEGRGRYNKVVASDRPGFGQSRRAVAFIDKQTSHMLRAGTWSKPARTRIA